MPMVNPFDIFSVSEISDAINVIPNNYGRLQQRNLLPVRGVVTRSVAIEEKNGTLALIPVEGGNAAKGAGKVGKVGKRKLRTFQVPRLVYDEFCGPEEVQGVRVFGGNDQDTLARLLNDKLAEARAKHDITLEHLRMGALKGIILDADGSELYDLYSEFGIAQKSIDFKLGTPTTDIRKLCLDVKRHIEDHLYGEVSNGVAVEVSPEFFDRFTGHAKVEAAYAGYQEASQRLGGDNRLGFTFAGLTLSEYRAISVKPDGNPIRFIAEGEGHAYPTGTSSTFRTYAAPADFNETVGQLGQLYYAKTMPAKFDRGWDIHTQSNPLPLCLRPSVLVRLFSSN